jgi:hypothetical protein
MADQRGACDEGERREPGHTDLDEVSAISAWPTWKTFIACGCALSGVSTAEVDWGGRERKRWRTVMHSADVFVQRAGDVEAPVNEVEIPVVHQHVGEGPG